MGVGLQTARDSADPPNRILGTKGCKGTEEARLRGLDDMANCGPQWVGDERVDVGASPIQMSTSETQRSRPRTHFLASRGGLKTKECPMCRRGSVHACLLCNTLISLFVKRDMHNKEQISTEGTLVQGERDTKHAIVKGGGGRLLDVVT